MCEAAVLTRRGSVETRETELKQIFDLCDRDRRGYLDRDAFRELGRKFFGGSEEQINVIVNYFDPADRGVITFEDFNRGVTAISTLTKHNEDESSSSSSAPSSPCSLESQRIPNESAIASPNADSTIAAFLRAQSPTDSGLDERNEERFECDYDEDLNGNKRVNDSLSSAKSLGNSFGKDLSAAAVANASLNSALSRRSSFSFGGEDNDDACSFTDHSQVVDDLTDKVQVMEMQMSVLSDDLSTNKDLYHRVRQENSSLTQRIHLLEENLREIEVKSEERLRDERRQFTQMIERKDRERSLEVDQHVNKILDLQKEHLETKEELIKLRAVNEQLRQERKVAVEQCAEAQQELQVAKQDHRALQDMTRKDREDYLREKQMSQGIVQELTQRIEELQQSRIKNLINHDGDPLRERSASFIQSLPAHYEAMEKELERMRLDNRRLKEKNEELEEELMELKVGRGQRLLQDGDPGSQDNNWAAETNNLAMLSKEELLEQLIKLKDTNVHLREYIGTVLSNIIMTNPQVLERKS